MRKLVGAFVVALVPTVASAALLQPWQQWAGSSASANLQVVPGFGDFTGDGKVDVVVYKPSTRKLWIGRSTGTTFSFCAAGGVACIGSDTEAWATLPTACAQGFQFYTGQFGGSTLPDVAVYNPCLGEVRVLINLGSSGGLTGVMASTDPLGGWKLIAGEFTGDSLTDVMVYYEGDGSIYVGTNGVFGFVWNQWAAVEPDPIGSGAEPWQFFPGDFDGNGRLDIVGYRPGGPGAWGKNTRVGLNTGSSTFAMASWSQLYAPDIGGTLSLVVANWTGTNRADVGVRYNGRPPDFGETYPDFDVLRNGDGSFVTSSNWTNLLPEDATWQFNAGDFVSTGASAGLPDLFAYYPGDGTFWVAENRSIPPEGYAWPLSAAPGETVSFFASGTLLTGQPNVVIQRISANASGTLIAEASPTTSLTVSLGRSPILGAGNAAMNGPQWPTSFTFTIPSGWPTGFYAATLKATDGQDFRITFVVKPPASARHRTAILANINTWNAYNAWGGGPDVAGMKYTGAAHTTFMRPNPSATLFVGSAVPPFQGTHLAHAEVWVLAAIESFNGVGRGNVDVYTDLDFNNGQIVAGAGVGQYDRLILSTHPEYWTPDMYTKLESFINAGGRVLYLGGNGVFESASYSTSPPGGSLNALTFLNGVDGGDRTNALFRGSVIAKPERKHLGIATTYCYSNATDRSGAYDVKPHPPNGTPERTIFNTIFQGAVSANDQGLARRVGSTGVLGAGASGHEIDKIAVLSGQQVVNQPPAECGVGFVVETNTTPAGLIWLAEGSNPVTGGGADMTFYRKPGAGFVFSVGSINFGQSLFLDTKLRKIVKNVYDMN